MFAVHGVRFAAGALGASVNCSCTRESPAGVAPCLKARGNTGFVLCLLRRDSAGSDCPFIMMLAEIEQEDGKKRET